MSPRAIQPPAPRLIDSARNVLVLCCREDVTGLERSLLDMGFQVEVRRQDLPAAQANYSAQAKCLLSHVSAWRRVCEIGVPSLVVEADFVPAKNFPDLPSPAGVAQEGCCAWLYSSAQRIYRVLSDSFASGQSATSVANYWDPAAALQAIDFGMEEEARHGGSYTPWDTYLRPALKSRGVPSLLIPWRSYGEHGGLPNSEHRRFGISATHRADVLYAPLAFLPVCALGCRRRYVAQRATSRAKAILRLLSGRYVEPSRFRDPFLTAPELARAIRFATSRLMGGAL